MRWPDGGPWLVTEVPAGAGWAAVTAALAAASKGRVAGLVIAGPEDDRRAATELVRDSVATCVEITAGGTGALRVEDLVGLTRALARSHELVLVAAAGGPLVPLGAGGATLADLAWALPAPVVLATRMGVDAANHTTLALDALTNRQITAAVVAVGDDEPVDLPVTPAGRIPAGALDRPERFAADAPGWLDPLLHGTRDRPGDTGESAGDERSTIIGGRVMAAIVALLVLAVLVLCALKQVGPAGLASRSR